MLVKVKQRKVPFFLFLYNTKAYPNQTLFPTASLLYIPMSLP